MSKQLPFETEKNEHCPECGSLLVIRNGAHGPFLLVLRTLNVIISNLCVLRQKAM